MHSDYFVDLMKNKFSYIFNPAIISILVGGFLAQLALPFSATAKNQAFTQWLDHNVVASGGENEVHLRNSIKNLPQHSSDFRMLLDKATVLVNSHKENFKIQPFFPVDEENEVSTWLIGQWNVFQHQKTTSNAVVPKLTKVLQKWLPDLSGPHASGSSENQIYSLTVPVFLSPQTFGLQQKLLSPFISGTAINAP
ncbi:MAG: hypothetical protein WD008_05785 [Balneolaceae bacterium]